MARKSVSGISTSTGLSAQDAFALLETVAKAAKAKGADDVEARITQNTGLSATVRNGQIEKLGVPTSAALSIAVHIGDKHATASIGTLKPAHIEAAIESAVLSARLASDNPYGRVADPADIIKSYAALDIVDPRVPSVEELKSRALRAEAAALAHKDTKISNSASAAWSRAQSFILVSNGFRGEATKTSQSVNASVVAGRGQEMAVGGEYSAAIYGSDLISPEDIGAQAALNAANKLGGRGVPSQIAPVIFDRDLAPRLLGAFANAASGPAVAQGASFLKNRMGDQVMNAAITIVDDPYLPRGLGSSPFDPEGMPSPKLTLVENGELKNWIMDLASARQLGLTSNGRGNGTTNLYMEAGNVSLEDLIKDIKQGFYVTELIGGGANVMTSRYSSGAGGFWIENGQIAFPVKELTLAGNLHDMFLNMTPANDLVKRRSSVTAPSLRIEGMTIGGR